MEIRSTFDFGGIVYSVLKQSSCNVCITWSYSNFYLSIECGFKWGGDLFQVLILRKLDSQRCALIVNGCVMKLWVGQRINQAT